MATFTSVQCNGSCLLPGDGTSISDTAPWPDISNYLGSRYTDLSDSVVTGECQRFTPTPDSSRLSLQMTFHLFNGQLYLAPN
jgi:hypothetical protein